MRVIDSTSVERLPEVAEVSAMLAHWRCVRRAQSAFNEGIVVLRRRKPSLNLTFRERRDLLTPAFVRLDARLPSERLVSPSRSDPPSRPDSFCTDRDRHFEGASGNCRGDPIESALRVVAALGGESRPSTSSADSPGDKPGRVRVPPCSGDGHDEVERPQ